jgi:hypothetical protein
MGRVTKQWEFQGTADQTTLAFATAETNGGFWHGPALDNLHFLAVTVRIPSPVLAADLTPPT